MPYFISGSIPAVVLLALLLIAAELSPVSGSNSDIGSNDGGGGKKRPGPALIDETTRWSRCFPVNQSIYDFNVDTLGGEATDLHEFKGDVLLIINVATFCAYTQQYNDLNPLLERNEGLKVLGFPCNQFYLQEPAENHEILNGIRHVRPGNNFQPHKNLRIFGKVEVNGDGQHPLFEFLKETCPQTVPQLGHTNELMYNPIRVSDITWNFEKFLIDRQGRPRFRFHPTAWTHGQVLAPFLQQLLAEGEGGGESHTAAHSQQ